MLTLQRRIAVFLAVVATCAVTLVVSAGPAAAEICDTGVGDGTVEIGDCDEGSEGDGEGNGAGSGPSCDIQPGDNGCWNGESCLINDPSTLELDEVPDGALPPKPGDDYHHAFRLCDSGYVWYWSEDGGPSIEELATQAFNSLPFPTITPTFNPPRRTIVNLETWWWAAGATNDELSASAGSVTVRATPSHREVDPGDGSGVMRCSFATTESDACTHVYRRSNAEGYAARMRLVWTLVFTDGGDVVELNGLPTEFTSPWTPVTVPVNEIQTRVTKVR